MRYRPGLELVLKELDFKVGRGAWATACAAGF
jgi:hypothetical protein